MTCPFIDSNNPHCNSHMNMKNLEDAYELCNHRYQLCPLYLSLLEKPDELVSSPVRIGRVKELL